ncbi:NAD-dependent epimerase/dehydratase family protein [Kribbella sp. NPDC051587]|uniref:NAD-dependent epimerase/dehydratase family protein n=1 Tax=Kribbella sp. NPDC051587 TaxID=3364119 RepID=UPI0037A37084
MILSDSPIIVTGAAGYLAHLCADEIAGLAAPVLLSDRRAHECRPDSRVEWSVDDLRSPDLAARLRSVRDRFGPKCRVLHLAGRFPKSKPERDATVRADYFADNAEVAANLISSLDAVFSEYLVVNTSTVFPARLGSVNPNALGDYAESKDLGADHLKSGRRGNWIDLSLARILGRPASFDKCAAPQVHDVITEIWSNRASVDGGSEALRVTNPRNQYSYIWWSDLARVVSGALSGRIPANRRYVVTPESPISLSDIANTVADQANSKSPISTTVEEVESDAPHPVVVWEAPSPEIGSLLNYPESRSVVRAAAESYWGVLNRREARRSDSR